MLLNKQIAVVTIIVTKCFYHIKRNIFLIIVLILYLSIHGIHKYKKYYIY